MTTREQFVLKVLQERPGLTFKALRAQVSGSMKEVLDALSSVRQARLVRAETDAMPAQFHLTDAGRKVVQGI